MNEHLNLIILGPQGSGKGTQAALLQKKIGAALFGAGDVLREIAKTDTALGKKVHETINVQGRLVEPELISEVIKNKIATVPKSQNLILDSYPRSLEQYELFKKFWPAIGRGDYRVLFIELTEDQALKRLLLRKRLDDSEETIRKRLELFNSLTMPMIKDMEQQNAQVIHINGNQTIEEVHAEILNKLGLSS